MYKKVFIMLLTSALACSVQTWKEINYRRKVIKIAASPTTEKVYALTKEKLGDGWFEIVRLENEFWQRDVSQPSGAKEVAVDNAGNPAIKDAYDVVRWKKDGWSWTSLPGKAFTFAFGREFFRVGGNYQEIWKVDEETKLVYLYNETASEWGQPYGNLQASRLTVDASGDPWVITDYGGFKVHKWDRNQHRWIYMGLRDANDIASGPAGNVYALALPYKRDEKTIYRWEVGQQWAALPGKGARSIAVGQEGRRYIYQYGDNVFSDEGELVKRCSEGPLKPKLLQQAIRNFLLDKFERLRADNKTNIYGLEEYAELKRRCR